VDLNRNYDALWEDYNGINRPSLRNYKGPSPESEPETRAMVALANSIPNIQAVICLHSQGEVLYWNCGQETELRDETLQFTQSVSDANGYRIITQQNNDASLSDWCALKRNLVAITVETGVDACPLPITQFEKIWTDNYQLLALSAKYFE
jgi:g-D-glutamyl-meso-diaminopimelate peptidase